MSNLPFLDDHALMLLTGWKQKRKQVQQLRAMGIPFRINARGVPIVAVSAIDGVKPVPGAQLPAWTPNVLKRA